MNRVFSSCQSSFASLSVLRCRRRDVPQKNGDTSRRRFARETNRSRMGSRCVRRAFRAANGGWRWAHNTHRVKLFLQMTKALSSRLISNSLFEDNVNFREPCTRNKRSTVVARDVWPESKFCFRVSPAGSVQLGGPMRNLEMEYCTCYWPTLMLQTIAHCHFLRVEEARTGTCSRLIFNTRLSHSLSLHYFAHTWSHSIFILNFRRERIV